MIRTSVIGFVSAMALVASANAADIYRGPEGGSLKDAPVYYAPSWTGFYVGVNGGYGWTEENSYYDFQPSGGFGGGQIGYNWQGTGYSSLVLGIEVDFQGADISDSFGPYESSLNWFGTVRGRLGFAVDKALIYATGGFAFGEIEQSGPVDSISDTATGWTVGGGVEYKVAPAWSVKVEYQFLNLSSDDVFALNGDNLVLGEDSEIHTVRAGINYHIGRSYEPLK